MSLQQTPKALIDIFTSTGDTCFWRLECRQQRMNQDERKKQRSMVWLSANTELQWDDIFCFIDMGSFDCNIYATHFLVLEVLMFYRVGQ
ncbi:hypothetical protein Syun_009678 [Stephania yunnanensis]|uniref:FLZ-type domain-containing protein n=1 Tax=Stephania yunnanensis TaxID=152371 RepID=A0AAP0KGV3_9MAGN